MATIDDKDNSPKRRLDRKDKRRASLNKLEQTPIPHVNLQAQLRLLRQTKPTQIKKESYRKSIGQRQSLPIKDKIVVDAKKQVDSIMTSVRDG